MTGEAQRNAFKEVGRAMWGTEPFRREELTSGDVILYECQHCFALVARREAHMKAAHSNRRDT